jgi:hypothetical protein
VKIESVYEENTCTTCGQYSIDQYSNIAVNYIKYRKDLISFIEIIFEVLDFRVITLFIHDIRLLTVVPLF